MSLNRFSHIDLRVPDLAAVLPFYEKLMPAIGFGRRHGDGQWEIFAGEGSHPSLPYVAITQEKDHRPNATRIAFWAGSREEVDRAAAAIRSSGCRNVQGPRPCPEYSPTYYAVYFEDPCGNRLEVCFRTD